MFTLCIKGAVRLLVDSRSHLYEDVGDEHAYQDILPSHLSPPPLPSDPRLPHQRTEWRSPARSQVHIRKKKAHTPLVMKRAPLRYIIHICRYHA